MLLVRMKTSAVVSLLACFFAGAVGICPDGFFRYGNSCYVIPLHTASWAEAKVYCQAVGADLAIIDGVVEEKLLRDFLQSHQGTYKVPKFWLDGQDYVEEGQWKWARTGQPVVGQWHAGEPDNLNGQHCLDFLGASSYLLDDDHCEDRQHFICEIETEDLTVG